MSVAEARQPCLKLVVFLSSCRPGAEEMGQWGRLADRMGLFVVKQLEARGHTVTLFDPKVQQLARSGCGFTQIDAAVAS